MKITIIPDGPYLVTGAVPLWRQRIHVDAEGFCHGYEPAEECPAGETYPLCRCGASKNPPFCDGSHEQAGFDGTETATHAPFDEQARRFQGPDVDLADVRELCAAARFCHRAGGTWDLVRHPETPGDRQTAIEESQDCPSGRLVTREKDGAAIEPELEPSIVLIEDTQQGVPGPIWVKGGIPVESADGRTYEVRNRVTLCRCGRSRNKPFCDGSHLG